MADTLYEYMYVSAMFNICCCLTAVAILPDCMYKMMFPAASTASTPNVVRVARAASVNQAACVYLHYCF